MMTLRLFVLPFVLCVATTAMGQDAAKPESGAANRGEARDEPEASILRRGRDGDGWTYLAYVKPLSYSVGHEDLRRFTLEEEAKLHIAGKSFATGLIAHAVSSVKYELAGKCTEFHASYGLPWGSVARFVVLCDGKEKFRSSRVWFQGGTRRFGIDKPIHLDVTGVKILELRTYGDDNGQTSGAFGAWGDPKVK